MFKRLTIKEQLSHYSVMALYQDERGLIWIGTRNGVNVYDGSELHTYRRDWDTDGELLSNSVRDITGDKNGKIFFLTIRGVSCFDIREETFTTLTQNNVAAMCYDRQLYIGVDNKVYAHDGSQFVPYYELPETGRKISSLSVSGDSLMIGTEEQGAYIYNRKSGSLSHPLQTGKVGDIFKDSKGRCWISTTDDGLYLLYKEHLTNFRRDAADARSICSDFIRKCREDRLGDIWIGTFRGLSRYTDGEEGFVNYLAADEKDAYSYNFETGILTPHVYSRNVEGTLSSNGVNCVYTGSDNHLWFCMAESGLDLYDYDTGTFRNFDERHNRLQNDCVYGACELSSDRLLVITDKGFSCLDSVTGYFRNFDVKSGLPLEAINQNAVYKASDGEIFIGGIDGMVSFQSDDLALEPYSYNIFPYKLFINDKEVKVGDETGVLERTISESPRITLRADQSMFSLVYAVTDYASLSRSYIMYKLENFQEEWVTMRGGRVITYTNLNPGKYTLLVKTDSHFGEEENISRLEIEVLPPFYKTVWAILLYILSGVVLLSYLIRTYKKRISLQTELKYERKHIKDVELLNQHKLRFFINISHEFRTPLTLIIGQMELLLQVRNFAPSVYNKILSVYKNGLQLQELITELLDFRKQEQGHMKIKVRQQNIVDFLHENYLLFCEYAVRRKIAFTFNKTCDTMEVWYDAKQLQKVINNLLSNAFKYTADGGEVALSVRKDKEEVIVEVTDNGCGIEEKELRHIFDRFYQSDRTLAVTGTGIGVGLALSKGIVDLHHGSIEALSTVNEGTTIVIRLPLGCEHFTEEEIVTEESPDFVPVERQRMKYEAMEEVAAVEEDGQEHKILIVEDEDDLRHMLVDIFRPYYTIRTAENGEQALESIAADMPDLVLTDVLMPGISGIELCKRLKENVATCHLPVMLLTARTAIEHRLEGLQTGADDYIIKPFDVNILLSRCKNLINNRIMLQEKYSKHPQKSSQILATTPADKEFMDRAMKVIEEHLDDNEFNMNVFASEMGVARTKLFSRLKSITNQTPNDLVLSVRMKKAATMLKENPELNITEIADRLGFCSSRYFSRCFKEKYNLTPQAYRRGEKGPEAEGE